MPDLNFEVWDVFTDAPFAGNPLAIVDTGGDLSTAQMQTIAREFNLSETIFLMPPTDPANTVRARIFFPTAEIPFAGHPTIGAALCLAARHALSLVAIEEEAGLVRVTVRDGRAELTAPVIPVGRKVDISADLCARAIGLAERDIGPHRPGVHEGGPAFAYVPVKTREALRRARPMEPAWTRLMEAAGVDSAWLYDPDFNARMFSPSAGIPEDPATGSASAIFASQLLSNGALTNGTNGLEICQGEDMGRPSRIGFEADVTNGQIKAVRISGKAVPVSRGRIRTPG